MAGGNAAWELVGSGPISNGGAICMRMAFSPQGEPTVSYHDMTAGGSARVQRFRNGAWEVLGTQPSVGTAWYNSIAYDSQGNLFLGSRDYMVGGRFVVRVLPVGSNTWSTLGGTGASPNEAHHTWLDLTQDGVPVIAYQDRGTTPIDRASVMRYDLASDSWQFVGPRGFSQGLSSYNTVKVGRFGELYAAHTDDALVLGNEVGLLSVQRYDSTTNSWKPLGNPLFSAVASHNVVMEIDREGMPWVALHRYHQSIRVFRFDGTDWRQVGGSATGTERPTYETEGYRQWGSLCFDSQNQPYISYQLFDYEHRGAVRRFDGHEWVPVGNSPISIGAADYMVMGISPDDVPFVAYRDMGASTRLIVKRFAPAQHAYGAANPNSLECVPQVFASGALSISANSGCTLAATQMLNNKSAMLLWSVRPAELSFGSGTLLVAPPVRRTVLLNTAGSSGSSDCSGSLSFDLNSYFASAPPGLAPGSFVFTQYWVRDPGLVGGVYLSSGMRFLLYP